MFGRGKNFGKFGEPSAIHQTKTIHVISNLLADLLICQTLFRQNLYPSTFAKRYHHQTFPLYGILYIHVILSIPLIMNFHSMLVYTVLCNPVLVWCI